MRAAALLERPFITARFGEARRVAREGRGEPLRDRPFATGRVGEALRERPRPPAAGTAFDAAARRMGGGDTPEVVDASLSVLDAARPRPRPARPRPRPRIFMVFFPRPPPLGMVASGYYKGYVE